MNGNNAVRIAFVQNLDWLAIDSEWIALLAVQYRRKAGVTNAGTRISLANHHVRVSTYRLPAVASAARN